ncbi:GNAT family N-acetyltransferase [Lutibaculum baratangense]|uniref:Ribosomal-protein-S18p-alanine acetyltransferase n=1 Tax=Lutibaculum baratangense AMV1 TaxID=631454 RepID=V4RIG7_9HYPH|nr:GNAT family N-acetyltransferase [Lutibaculum baratangense]ESR25881.1 Ribosomal-protein-S18p-alanine acetyltransferase [Lutibaculum baratangense AMV1]
MIGERVTLSAADAECASRLHAETMAAPWSAESFRELLKSPTLFGHGFRRNGSGLDALLLIRALPGEAEIYTVAVAPARRREGLASALLRHGLSQVRSRGAEVVFLEVDEGNAGARALYRGLGFVSVGRRKNYYRSSNGADAILMRLDLQASTSAA